MKVKTSCEFAVTLTFTIAIGPEGSGTHALAIKFLEANGMGKGGTRLLELDGNDAIEALKQGTIDAALEALRVLADRKITLQRGRKFRIRIPVWTAVADL